MASLSSPTTLLLFSLLLLSLLVLSSSSHAQIIQRRHLSGVSNRRMLAASAAGGEEGDDGVPIVKVKSPPKKKTLSETKNQTKLIKPKKSNSADTTATEKAAIKAPKVKLNKAINASKPSSSTKLPKAPSAKPTKSNSTKLAKTQLKPLTTTKPLISPKKTKASSPPPLAKKKAAGTDSKPQQPKNPDPALKPSKPKPKQEPSLSWLEQDDNDSIGLGDMSDFHDLPSRLLLPDLEKISTTSRVYLSRANREIVRGVRPFVGNKYAPTIASFASGAFLLLPLLLLTLLFHHLKSYLSLQRILIFIQAYLAIYFATLSLTAVTTGLEPLRFFYAASPAAYAWTQAVQTLGYMLYLLAQMVHLVVAFSSDSGSASTRGLALAQMLVGLAVGLHYYVVVFHRAVAGEPPRASWRVHGVYAACFLAVCALARAERRKKAYLSGAAGDEDGKKS